MPITLLQCSNPTVGQEQMNEYHVQYRAIKWHCFDSSVYFGVLCIWVLDTGHFSLYVAIQGLKDDHLPNKEFEPNN